jgi:hypothetical protein
MYHKKGYTIYNYYILIILSEKNLVSVAVFVFYLFKKLLYFFLYERKTPAFLSERSHSITNFSIVQPVLKIVSISVISLNIHRNRIE